MGRLTVSLVLWASLLRGRDEGGVSEVGGRPWVRAVGCFDDGGTYACSTVQGELGWLPSCRCGSAAETTGG